MSPQDTWPRASPTRAEVNQRGADAGCELGAAAAEGRLTTCKGIMAPGLGIEAAGLGDGAVAQAGAFMLKTTAGAPSQGRMKAIMISPMAGMAHQACHDKVFGGLAVNSGPGPQGL